jgi:hypothetical protein
LHCKSLVNSYQKLDVKRASRSDTIFYGIPYLQTQCSKNRFAASTADMAVWQGINLHNLENLSMMLNIASKPRVLTGRCVTKSIVICSKGLFGFSTGYSRPVGFWVECLFA